MSPEDFVRNLYLSAVTENLCLYRQMYEQSDENQGTNPQWKACLALYRQLTQENQATLFQIIKQIQVDTVSTVLGIIDGVVTVEEEVELELVDKGYNEIISGDLQDLFLAFNEDND